MRSIEIREKFLTFFEGLHHRRIKSSALIPAQDPTLLFTNAGMVQFKDCFLGVEVPEYRRATTSQKCVRAGGKHNDLENVGITPRHHTFFEMLGNFSFGDYFKKEAIAFAWELLTQHYKLPKDRLRITVFKDDEEAFELWRAQGVSSDWIVRLGEKDNFWAMGETGPCGPCSEIHFDWGAQYGCGKASCAPGCPCDTRFLEIWNLVFMQFNRDSQGRLDPLPKPSVDTGAGLERLCAVLQGVYSNYDTDLFSPIIASIAQHVGLTYRTNADSDISMRVIADHVRAGTFLIADGVIPSNEGRGYVLRRILRRAIRHGKKLGQETPFIHSMVGNVVTLLGSVYPEIVEAKGSIEALILEEEQRFHQTLHRGMGLLEESLSALKSTQARVLPGEVVFKLYDSFGFPIDLIQVMCQEQGIAIDEAAFNALMEKQRQSSSWGQPAAQAATDKILRSLEGKAHKVTFEGYGQLESTGTITHLWNHDGVETESLSGSGFLMADRTPFYAESGGQVGDRGTISSAQAQGKVINTVKVAGGTLHCVEVIPASVRLGETVQMTVDPSFRRKTAINHTATHLLHAALRKVLGSRIKQAGSLVEPSRLRFDFSFPRALTPQELTQIEESVNGEIDTALPVSSSEMDLPEALKLGALAFFDDKYGDRVRVVRVGNQSDPLSIELCGGTHLDNISDIRCVKITSESSVASGIRRIEAITADSAMARFRERDEILRSVESHLGAKAHATVEKIEQLQAEIKTLRKELEKIKLSLGQGGAGTAFWERKTCVRDLQVVMEKVPDGDPKVLRTLSDQIRDKLQSRAVIILAGVSNSKVSLCVGISKDLVGRLDARAIIKPLAAETGGTGGGRADFAQGGGTDSLAIDGAFLKLRALLEKQDVT